MRKIHLIVPLILLALAGAYWLGRSQPRLARSGAEGVDVGASVEAAGRWDPEQALSAVPGRGAARGYLAELQAAADAGDLTASTRLYRSLDLCHRLRASDWSNALLANELLEAQTRGMTPAELENYRAQLDGIESRKRNAQRINERCAGADAATLDTLVPSMRRAAQLGEPHARACYLAMGPGFDSRALARHPEWLDQFRGSVPGLIDAGMAAGDWTVVNILRNAYQPDAGGLLAGVLGPDPARHFRYLKLYRLGAGPGDIAALDQQLAVAAARLSPEQRSEAENWAETTFRRDFNGRSSVDAPGLDRDPCVFPQD